MKTNTIFRPFDGYFNDCTEVELIDSNGTVTFYGPYLTACDRPQNESGSPQWLDHIFVSDRTDRQEAYDEAERVATRYFAEHPQKMYPMSSSFCGLCALVHVIKKGQTREMEFEVTRMEVDPSKPKNGQPMIVGARAWKKKSLMKAFDLEDFNTVANFACAAQKKPFKRLASKSEFSAKPAKSRSAKPAAKVRAAGSGQD